LFDTPVQFFFDGVAGATSRRSNSKGAAALDPLSPALAARLTA